ncbi:MAG: aquaporin [Candidatus Poseidoniales archaeon]|tara:strand:- start:414 stop:1064 length:651 start_codon:yes stop_codon:yes gene_type:complete
MKSLDYMFENTNWKAVSAEIMGTFFLVFFGVSSLANNVGVNNDETGNLFPESLHLLIGLITLTLTLFVLVHILGPVSGCHLNPVITIPTFLSDKMDRDTTVAYIFGQIIGACLGFYLFDLINPGTSDTILDGDSALLLAALVGTAFFVTSLLTSQDPASIGATLFVVSSTAFGDVNPGVSLGNMITNDIDFMFFGIVGSLIGCIIGWAIKENIIDQ